MPTFPVTPLKKPEVIPIAIIRSPDIGEHDEKLLSASQCEFVIL